MTQLTQKQCEMVVNTVMLAKHFGKPLAEYVAEDIASSERHAAGPVTGSTDRIREGRRHHAERCASNAAMMRQLREMFASWRQEQ